MVVSDIHLVLDNNMKQLSKKKNLVQKQRYSLMRK